MSGSKGSGVWGKSPPLLSVSPGGECVHHQASLKADRGGDQPPLFNKTQQRVFILLDRLTRPSLDSNVCIISRLFFVSFLSSVMSVETLE